jgi:LCP family protein required for cell wall assembly
MPGSPASDSPKPRRVAIDDEPAGGTSSGFGGAVGWTVLGTLIPGLGYIRAGRKILGGTILGVLIVAIAGGATYAVLNQRALTQALATNPTILYAISGGLLVLALAWVLMITTTHLSLRPRPATVPQRILGGVLVGVLSFAVAAPMAFGANLIYSSTGLLDTFGGDNSQVNTADPWNGADRLNVLLLGGDSGTKRATSLGARTDTVIVASIDVHTGATTLFTFPRNATKMPFPPDSPLHKYYPNGFTDPSNIANAEYFLNAMYRNVPAHVPNNILGKTKDFGAAVMMQSVGYALGLKIDYYGFINMDGFKDLINAVGGITVNVNYRIPVGGHNASGSSPEQAPEDWIEVGPNKHLTGGYALWYARGRYHLDDYSRMERQRCVINAVIKQANPQNVLTNFQAVVDSGKKTIVTNFPSALLPDLVNLGLKAKNAKLRSLVLSPDNGFVFGQPNWDKVRAMVKKSLQETTADNTQTPTTTATPSAPVSSTAPSGTPSGSATPSSTPSTKSEDLEDACAYHPHAYNKK